MNDDRLLDFVCVRETHQSEPCAPLVSVDSGALMLCPRGETLGHVCELVRAATRTCGNRETAEDMVQEAYMRAWKYWDRFEPGTNCRAWLYKILFNVIRRRKWRPTR